MAGRKNKKISAEKSALTSPVNPSQDAMVKESLLLNRRTFFATAALLGLGRLQTGLSGLQTLLMMPETANKVEEWRRKRKATVEREDELRELLSYYLFPSNPGGTACLRVPLVPALRDPWGPPERKFSGSGNEVSAAYISAFTSADAKDVIEQAIDVEPDDAPVLIGSHLTSEAAARYFGDPKSPHPIHEIRYHDAFGGFKAKLRWAIHIPNDAKPIKTVELFQGEPRLRESPSNKLTDFYDPKLKQPEFVLQGDVHFQLSDYLLITVLPRDSRFDRRSVSLAGVHKMGTLAAGELLNDSQLALELLRSIQSDIQGLAYFQALIGVTVDHRSGLPRPTNLKFIAAHPLEAVMRI